MKNKVVLTVLVTIIFSTNLETKRYIQPIIVAQPSKQITIAPSQEIIQETKEPLNKSKNIKVLLY